MNQDYLNSIIAGARSSVRFEKWYIHKDGRIVWVDISTILQRDNDGLPLYFITSIQDITDHKKYFDTLQIIEQGLKMFESGHFLL